MPRVPCIRGRSEGRRVGELVLPIGGSARTSPSVEVPSLG